MIHLPVRLAVSVPVGVAATIAFVFAIFNVGGTRLPLWIKLYQLSGLTLVGSAVSLLFVAPNLVAALIANRFARQAPDPLVPFALCFAAAVALMWFAQASLLDRTLGGVGGFPTKVLEWKTWLLIGADVAVCLVTALWVGRSVNA